MTLEEIEAIPKDFLTVSDISPYMRSNPNDLRAQAWQRPDLLGFPIVFVRRRIKIPKTLFVQHFRGQASGTVLTAQDKLAVGQVGI